MAPRWYLPPDTPRPAHWPAGGIAVTAGPDGLPGLAVNGPYHPDEPGWTRTAAGTWLHWLALVPADLLILSPLDGIEITGREPDHRWLVPRLLAPRAGGLVCALDRVWTPAGFVPPPHLADLCEDLCAVMSPIVRAATADPAQAARLLLDERALPDHAHLAARVLAINYRVNGDELAASGWITEAVILRTLLAACGGDDGG
jgi:hypothetical protein